ncbi:PEP-CTERM sorting domain-containing protein [Novipirellula artificiosorum]|uniref:Ice-binding protein C-terminal domain-containing protein n=1 Tax=Novipirellula artificiosorum TaxID=2528016 RepID=A0A5C6DUY8_9BACT|nr:PEP-CTERM sorting domain-containing protein [Novipirellula artificiosorum]TWU39757.1 hypothetical protein Poly41_26130 [Novipirellula artificiosorum]
MFRTLLLSSLFVAISGVTASAGSILSIIDAADGSQLWSDNSGDSLFNQAGGATTVDIGDVLIGQFSINTIEYLDGIGTTEGVGLTSGNNEFTGSFAIQVAAKGGGPGAYTFGFAPTDAASRLAISAALPGFGAELSTWDSRSMAAFYDGGALINYTREGGTLDSSIATATDGTKLFEAGFLSQLGEGWAAFAFSDDIVSIGTGALGSIGGFFNVGVNVIPGTEVPTLKFNLVDTVFDGAAQANISGSGSLLAKGSVVTPYESFNNVDFTVDVDVVPEPASIAIFGAMGLGLIGFRRRRSA